jgi:hypothetical protein
MVCRTRSSERRLADQSKEKVTIESHDQTGAKWVFALWPTSLRMREACAPISREFGGTVPQDHMRSDLATRLISTLEAPSTRAAGQLGPWDTGYGDGDAVGGYANLTLYQNGAYNFSGHFHVSGAISYDDSFDWAVKDSNNPATIYAFAHTGASTEPSNPDHVTMTGVARRSSRPWLQVRALGPTPRLKSHHSRTSHNVLRRETIHRHDQTGMARRKLLRNLAE